MERPFIYYKTDSYIESASLNKISKKSVIRRANSDSIKLTGKCIIQDFCILRGDLAEIKIGRYVSLGEGVILKPSYRKSQG